MDNLVIYSLLAFGVVISYTFITMCLYGSNKTNENDDLDDISDIKQSISDINDNNRIIIAKLNKIQHLLYTIKNNNSE